MDVLWNLYKPDYAAAIISEMRPHLQVLVNKLHVYVHHGMVSPCSQSF